MGSFGENLRREREMRGVTLEEISVATKISVRFLKSIEGEDFSKLPGGLFNRSFIRAYARYLGLDEDPILAEYQLAAKAKGEADITGLSLPVVHSSRKRTSSRYPWLGVAVAVVLLVAGFALWRHSRRSTESVSPETTQLSLPDKSSSHGAAPASPAEGTSAKSSASTAGSHSQTVKTASAQADGTAPAAAKTASQAAAPVNADYGNKLVLQIATTERSWVAIDADGKTVMQGIMNANEVKTLKANESFDVLTGNARGVVLTLNGQTLKPLGREGEVRSVHLTREDLNHHPSP